MRFKACQLARCLIYTNERSSSQKRGNLWCPAIFWPFKQELYYKYVDTKIHYSTGWTSIPKMFITSGTEQTAVPVSLSLLLIKKVSNSIPGTLVEFFSTVALTDWTIKCISGFSPLILPYPFSHGGPCILLTISQRNPANCILFLYVKSTMQSNFLHCRTLVWKSLVRVKVKPYKKHNNKWKCNFNIRWQLVNDKANATYWILQTLRSYRTTIKRMQIRYHEDRDYSVIH